MQYAGGVGVRCVAKIRPRSALNGAVVSLFYHALTVLSRDFDDL